MKRPQPRTIAETGFPLPAELKRSWEFQCWRPLPLCVLPSHICVLYSDRVTGG